MRCLFAKRVKPPKLLLEMDAGKVRPFDRTSLLFADFALDPDPRPGGIELADHVVVGNSRQLRQLARSGRRVLNFHGPGENGVHLNTACQHVAGTIEDVAATWRDRNHLLLLQGSLFDVGRGFDNLKVVKARTDPKAPDRQESSQDTNTVRR